MQGNKDYYGQLEGDECDFNTYDKNKDEKIQVGELVDSFGPDIIRKGTFKKLKPLKEGKTLFFIPLT